MTLLLAACFGAFALALMLHPTPAGLSPDGAKYLALARGEAVPTPFNARWLLPRVLGERIWAWRLASWGSVIALPVLVAAYVPERPLGAAALMAFLPIQRVAVRFPVLVDPVAMCLALGSALAWRAGHGPAALALVVVAGLVKESAPVFAAAYAWHPLLLVGCLPALLFQRTRGKPAVADRYCGRGSLAAARLLYAERRHDFLRWQTALLPWWMLVPLFLLAAAPDRRTLVACVALALGYGQQLVATDGARLFQWAAPAVIAVAVHAAISPQWMLLACALHAFNPYRGV